MYIFLFYFLQLTVCYQYSHALYPYLLYSWLSTSKTRSQDNIQFVDNFNNESDVTSSQERP